jgi:hypothetical protein
VGEAPWTPWPPRENDFKEKHRTEATEDGNWRLVAKKCWGHRHLGGGKKRPRRIIRILQLLNSCNS